MVSSDIRGNEFGGENVDYSGLPKDHIFHTLSKENQAIVKDFMASNHLDKEMHVQANILESVCKSRDKGGSLDELIEVKQRKQTNSWQARVSEKDSSGIER
jgi:hypothetical protein